MPTTLHHNARRIQGNVVASAPHIANNPPLLKQIGSPAIDEIDQEHRRGDREQGQRRAPPHAAIRQEEPYTANRYRNNCAYAYLQGQPILGSCSPLPKAQVRLACPKLHGIQRIALTGRKPSPHPVDPAPDASLSATTGSDFTAAPATVDVELRDGRRLTQTVEHERGSPERPRPRGSSPPA